MLIYINGSFRSSWHTSQLKKVLYWFRESFADLNSTILYMWPLLNSSLVTDMVAYWLLIPHRIPEIIASYCAIANAALWISGGQFGLHVRCFHVPNRCWPIKHGLLVFKRRYRLLTFWCFLNFQLPFAFSTTFMLNNEIVRKKMPLHWLPTGPTNRNQFHIQWKHVFGMYRVVTSNTEKLHWKWIMACIWILQQTASLHIPACLYKHVFLNLMRCYIICWKNKLCITLSS